MTLEKLLARMLHGFAPADAILATREGRILAALVEAAVAWLPTASEYDVLDPDAVEALRVAVDAYLALEKP